LVEWEWNDKNSVDLSRNGYTEFPEQMLPEEERDNIQSLQIHHNSIGFIPTSIETFTSLVILDVSNNRLSHIADEFSNLASLQTLVAKNNNLDDDSLPKAFDQLKSLRAVNLGGNNLTEFPPQLIHMPDIQKLYLGSNKISDIPNTIQHMHSLEVLNLGDNHIETVPAELGSLSKLVSINLACNRIRSLPRTMIRLRKLRSLSLHNNRLATLPPELVSINLVELSLRNNPLVVRFVQSMTYEVPSLMELAGRTIKLAHIPYKKERIPTCLDRYLRSANKCVNPRCKGVFFSAKVEHVKFVDFCGKYKLPLLQYLCSPTCSDDLPYMEGSSDSESDEEMRDARERIKRVLLG